MSLWLPYKLERELPKKLRQKESTTQIFLGDKGGKPIIALEKTMLTREKENYLREIYLDPSKPTSFGGVDKLYHYIKDQECNISRSTIKKWLSKQSPLYRKAVRKFKRSKVTVPTKQYMLDSNTVNYEKYTSPNNSYTYIAVFLDILLHYLYTVPLKSLKFREMAQGHERGLQKQQAYFVKVGQSKRVWGHRQLNT